MSRTTLALAALVAGAAFAPTALADTQPVEVRINISDLNLASAQDVNTLYKRINAAATDACYDNASVNRFDRPGCRKRIVSNAVANLNIPALGVAFQDVYKEEARTASIR